jgi:hypothetical protein
MKKRIFTAAVAAIGGLILCGISAAAQASPAIPPHNTVAMSTINSIACPTKTECVGVGISASGLDAQAVLIHNADSTKLGPIVKNLGVRGHGDAVVVCDSKTTCFSGGEGVSTLPELARISVATGKMTILAKIPTPNTEQTYITAGACQGTKGCWMIGWQGVEEGAHVSLLVHLSPAGKILKVTKGAANTALDAISCENDTTCMGIYTTASTTSAPVFKTFSLVKGAFKLLKAFPAKTDIASLSCYGTKLCVALGYFNDVLTGSDVVTVDPSTGAIGKAVSLAKFTGNLNALDCFSAADCSAVGFDTEKGGAMDSASIKVYLSKGVLKFTENTAYAFDRYPYNGVGCMSSTCYGVGPASATSADSVIAQLITS